MKALLHQAESAQNLASNPRTSVWVAASAGTGKTKVLTDRLLKLLLEENEPHRILCLTFTKAAAAEMANRLHKKLSQWAVLNENELKSELHSLRLNSVNKETYSRAKKLFTYVLDTPGGLKIQTIHGFCQALLKRFPLEAGIPPHFEVLDEQLATDLLHQAQLLTLNNSSKSETETRALQIIARHFDTIGFTDLLQDIQSARFVFHEEDIELPLHDLEESLIHSACQILDSESLKTAASLLLQGKKTDQERGTAILEWVLSSEKRYEDFEGYTLAFLTNTSSIRKTLCTTDLSKKYPLLLDILEREALRLETLKRQLNALKVKNISDSLHIIGKEIIKNYTYLKTQQNFLDYNDLIEKTVSLLSQPEIAPWVLYKLDGGLDHILVDEAQDTSPSQWKIISALAEEFLHNPHEDKPLRTLFVVGDTKQSIYSFQGADPATFIQMKHRFGESNELLKRPWNIVDLTTSFRSSEAILKVVDDVFKHPELKSALLQTDHPIEHQAFRQGHAGRVEVWPLCSPEDSDSSKPWELPVKDYTFRLDPAHKAAELIAEKIGELLSSNVILAAKKRVIKASDILILVQRRGSFVPKLIKVLKQKNISVAGSDRMVLNDQLIVKDLLALGEFLLLPEDDLTLATLLKSPLYSLTETEIYELCVDRKRTLWTELLKSNKHQEAVASLKYLLNLQDHIRPYELYMEVLTTLGGKRNFVRRFGHECLDPLEEFLAHILLFEKTHTPTLQGFVYHMRKRPIEIKRDFDQAERDEVRVMTVHGAKGLQAPVVILADTIRTPTTPENFLQKDEMLIWSPPQSQDTPLTLELKTQARQKRMEEYWRLLYVAMTRAEDRLYVCGWQTKKNSEATNWYSVIYTSLQSIGIHQGEMLVYESGYPLSLLPANENLVNEKIKELPSWISLKASLESLKTQWVNPSTHSLESRESRAGESSFSPEYAALRGTLIHKLLEIFPKYSQDPEEKIRSFLQNPHHKLSGDQQIEIYTHTLKILNSLSFKSLLGPCSYTEVPIVGYLNETYISGQIDRLIEQEDRILAIDYKTNQTPFQEVAEVPSSYLSQMRLYRDLLQPLYPRKKVVTALFWTESLELMIVE